MSTKKKRRAKLVCPVSHRGKRVRASKGACFITLASGKKKRIKKVADKHRDRERRVDAADAADARHWKRLRSDPAYRDRIASASERAQGLRPGSSHIRTDFAGRRR